METLNAMSLLQKMLYKRERYKEELKSLDEKILLLNKGINIAIKHKKDSIPEDIAALMLPWLNLLSKRGVHLGFVYGKEYQCTCPYCQETFRTKSGLLGHLQFSSKCRKAKEEAETQK